MVGLKKGEYLGINERCFHADGISFIDTRYQEKVFDGWHHHENAHLTFVLQGGNFEKREYSSREMAAGTSVFYHSHELHRNDRTIFPSRNLNLEIEPSFLQRFSLTEAGVYRSLANNPMGKFLLLKMYREIRNADNLTSDSLQMLFLGAVANNGQESEQKRPSWINRIHQLLNDQWDDTPTLSQLAATAAVYPTSISKHFPRYFGCTLGEYMRRLKVEKALGLLRSGRYSLTEIAYHCGFADQSHFTRVFRTQTGFLPRQYQQL